MRAQVTDDAEIMAWWKEVQEKGHPDKAEGWPELTDIASLAEVLTTIAWTGSAHHAAVNFGALAALLVLLHIACHTGWRIGGHTLGPGCRD